MLMHPFFIQDGKKWMYNFGRFTKERKKDMRVNIDKNLEEKYNKRTIYIKILLRICDYLNVEDSNIEIEKFLRKSCQKKV